MNQGNHYTKNNHQEKPVNVSVMLNRPVGKELLSICILRQRSGEDMGALGQVTCSFTINSQPFTQSFIVCRHMAQLIILGTDFTSTNFVGIIWTREGTQKIIQSNGSTIIELPDTTSGIPLVLAHSIKIRPGGNLEVPLECTRKLTNHMDIWINTGFHHKNPNVSM